MPFLFLGGNILNPISVYLFTSMPVFNGGVFSLLQSLFNSFGTTEAVTFSRVAEYSVFGAVLIWMLWMILKKPHQDIQLMRYAGILITVYIAFSSTVQPW